MPDQVTVSRAHTSPDPRVVIVDGYGASLTISRGHLVIKDGVGRYRRERRFSRTDARSRDGIARLVIMAETGYIALDVIKWCDVLNIPIIHVGLDGSIGFTSPGMVATDARLYRQQVLSGPDMPNSNNGLMIVRQLLTAKIAGQLEVLRMMGQDSPRMTEYLTMMATSRDIRAMFGAEGNSANLYWQHWENHVYVPWELSVMSRIPAHWNTFNGRAGITTRGNGYANASNRNATDFVNACLNYSYKICEIESMYACYTVGLHPALGLSHGAIHDSSPAMALDILEPLRPIADQVVLSYLDYGHGIPFDDAGKPAYLGEDSARELNNGTCRLLPIMASQLATVVSMTVAPHALRWAEMIAKSLATTEKITIIAPIDPRIRERSLMPTLADDITVTDLIPDDLWAAVSPMLPDRKQIGIAVSQRHVLAAIVAHEIYGCSWPKSVAPFGCKHQTARARLAEWQEAGIWQSVRAEITRPGITQSSIADVGLQTPVTINHQQYQRVVRR